MTNPRFREILPVDASTGEILDSTPVYVPKKHYFQSNHLTMFQDVLNEVAKMKLQGNSLRVLMLLLSKMDMENICIIPFSAIGNELNMKIQNVSKAIKDLADKNIIIKGEQKIGKTPSLRFNNTLVWKGKTKTYKMVPKDGPLAEKEGIFENQLNLFKTPDNEEIVNRFESEKAD